MGAGRAGSRWGGQQTAGQETPYRHSSSCTTVLLGLKPALQLELPGVQLAHPGLLSLPVP